MVLAARGLGPPARRADRPTSGFVAAGVAGTTLALYRDIGDRYNEATVLITLGDTHQAAGDLPAGGHAWRSALHILDQLNHPDAEQVRIRLGRAASPEAGGRAGTDGRGRPNGTG